MDSVEEGQEVKDDEDIFVPDEWEDGAVITVQQLPDDSLNRLTRFNFVSTVLKSKVVIFSYACISVEVSLWPVDDGPHRNFPDATIRGCTRINHPDKEKKFLKMSPDIIFMLAIEPRLITESIFHMVFLTKLSVLPPHLFHAHPFSTHKHRSKRHLNSFWPELFFLPIASTSLRLLYNRL